MLYIRMGMTMLASLYTSRVILQTLGLEDYGIYNIVGGVVVFFSFMSMTLQVAIRRFMATELGHSLQNNNIQNVYRASVQAIAIASVIILIGLETIGLWFINHKLSIPPERIYAANWVFQFSLLTFIFNTNALPFNALIVVYEKMGIYAYLGILDVVLKLALVCTLPFINADKLITFSIMMCAISLLIILYNIIYCQTKIIPLKQVFKIEKIYIREIFHFSAWSVFGSIVFMLATQGVNMIFNIFFGVLLNAAMGVSQQVSNAVNQFISNFQTAFNPQLTKNYAAEGLSENTFKLVCQTSKMSIILILLIGYPIVANINDLLGLWLTTVPEYAAEFCIISILYIGIDGSAGPLYMLVYSNGNIRNYQVLLSLIQILYIVCVYILCKIGFNPVAILSFNIINCMLMYIARLFILKRIMKFPIKLFIRKTIVPLIFPLLLLTIISYNIEIIQLGKSAVTIITRIILTFGLSSTICYLLYLTKEEKSFISNMIKNRIKR